MGQALETVERIVAAFDAGDVEGVRALLHPDVVLVAPGEVHRSGREEAFVFGLAFMRALTDVSVEVHLQAEQDDLVIEEYTMSATHSGPLSTSAGLIPATSRRVSLRVAELYRVRSGLVVENRLYYDETALLRQVGALPVGGPTSGPKVMTDHW